MVQQPGHRREDDTEAKAAPPRRTDDGNAPKRGDAHTTPHPIGSVAGAVAGAGAGAIAGVAAGPVGSLAGAVAGATAGTLGGVVPGPADVQHEHRDARTTRELTPQQREAASVFGAHGRRRLGPGAQWSDAEPSLRALWRNSGADTSLPWDRAADAVRQGFQR